MSEQGLSQESKGYYRGYAEAQDEIARLTRENDELREEVALFRSVLIDARAALRAINTSGAILQIDAALNTDKETG